MYRFFCPALSAFEPDGLTSAPAPDHRPAIGANSPELTVHLDPEETHHARRVLRLELGQAVLLFDGQGRTARGTLAAWNDGAVPGNFKDNTGERRAGRALVRVEEITHQPPPRPVIDLAAAIPKGGHADDMIASLSQLGVNQLIPLRAQRTVVNPRQVKIARFNRAAIESAKQCGRAYLMTVAAPATLQQVFALDHDLRLIAAPATPGASAGANNLPPAAIADRLGGAARVLILIGPEGGWSADELSSSAAAKCVAWSLGPHILRIETAAAATAAIAGYLTHATG